MKLNDTQLTAAEHKDGPMLVLAGPGSGKTTVIAARTINLIRQHQILPEHILVVTFTKAAANNMKERFLQATNQTFTKVTFSTLHSVFYKILSYYTNLKANNILSEETKYELIQNLMAKIQVKTDDKAEFIKQTILNISSIKTGILNLNNLTEDTGYTEHLKELYTRYEETLKQNRLLDFDDLILYCYRLLLSKPEILTACQMKFKYILVDEFQDISFLQYRIIRLLAEPEQNLFVVGDDDQSIYSFRGANPQIMLNFPKDYPNTKLINLDTNYRSGERIVTAAKKIILNNKARYSKTLTPANKTNDKIFWIRTANIYKQNEYIIEKIMHDATKDYSAYAVLCRTNKEQSLIISSFLRHNIPFTAKDAGNNLFNNMAASDIIAYLEAAQQLKAKKTINRETFLRIMNKPVRYIERASLRKTEVESKALQKAHITKHWAFGKIIQLFDDLKKLSTFGLNSAIDYILDNINYRNYLEDYCQKLQLSLEDFENQIFELKTVALEFKKTEQLLIFIKDYEKQLNTKKNHLSANKNAVTVATFHSAKGLEFNHVFIINCVNGIIPYSKTNKPNFTENTEEERRLFYVGITRAKESLYLIVPQSMYGKTKVQSPFLDELML